MQVGGASPLVALPGTHTLLSCVRSSYLVFKVFLVPQGSDGPSSPRARAGDIYIYISLSLLFDSVSILGCPFSVSLSQDGPVFCFAAPLPHLTSDDVDKALQNSPRLMHARNTGNAGPSQPQGMLWFLSTGACFKVKLTG